LRQKFEVGNRLCAVAHSCPDAIIASISSANHDDLFAFCTDIAVVLELRIQEGLGVELGIWLRSCSMRKEHNILTCKNSIAK
jgi:hypothetical protein